MGLGYGFSRLQTQSWNEYVRLSLCWVETFYHIISGPHVLSSNAKYLGYEFFATHIRVPSSDLFCNLTK
jgi:hypothetical protein